MNAYLDPEAWEAIKLSVAYMQNVSKLSEKQSLDHREVQRSTGCSVLQAEMVTRVLHDASGADDVLAPEAWTSFSGEYMPVAWRKASPDLFGKYMKDLALRSVVGQRLTAKAWLEYGIELWSGRHIEHAGCELRKRKDNWRCVRKTKRLKEKTIEPLNKLRWELGTDPSSHSYSWGFLP